MSAGTHDKAALVHPQFELELPVADEAGATSLDGFVTPRIRVSRRARRLSVRVYPDARVEVVAPLSARAGEVERFIQAHREWIAVQRAAALARRPMAEAFPPERLELRSTGESWRLQVAGGAGRPRLEEIAGSGTALLRIGGNASGVSLRAAMRNWLLRAARQRLEPRVAALAAATGTRYARVSLRRQRSRWGSCSVRGTISLNACLLFQRSEVVDYLIVHELMHVRHMNHSARFWQAVESHCAGWRELDRELLQGWKHVPRWVFADN